MLSAGAELVGFGAFVLGVYELAGRGWALLALAFALIILGQGLDGLRVRLRRRRAEPKPKRRQIDEPLTNEAFERLMEATAAEPEPD